MMTTPEDLEKRLQARYQRLVQEHLGQGKPTAAGPRILPAEESAFAATQAAWRFWRNPRITLPQLAQPLLSQAREAVAQDCRRYVLVVHDWSHLNYAGQASKQDCLSGATPGELGYELQSALAVSDATGRPLAPVYQGLRAADGLH